MNPTNPTSPTSNTNGTELVALLRQKDYPYFQWRKVPQRDWKRLRNNWGLRLRAVWKIPTGNPSCILGELSSILDQSQGRSQTAVLITQRGERPSWIIEQETDKKKAKANVIEQFDTFRRVSACMSMGQTALVKAALRKLYKCRRTPQEEERDSHTWRTTDGNTPEVREFLIGTVPQDLPFPSIPETVEVRRENDQITAVKIQGVVYN